MRTDIRVIGNCVSNKDSIEIDVSIVNLKENSENKQEKMKSIEEQIEQRYKEKERKYSGKTKSEFIPFILSTAGILHKDAKNIIWTLISNSKNEWVKHNIFKELSCKIQKNLIKI